MSNLPFPKEGTKAPDFKASTQDGNTISLKDLRGKQVVLYFYPKDDTPGCTKEACGFRDGWKKFEKADVVVLGVSPDSEKSHKKFSEKYELPFVLLADEDRSIIKKYNVWGEKQFMGRKYMGVHRTTFLIDKNGMIQKVWPKVKAEEHANEVLSELKKS
jgi:peroxiredoxin Q/BCP